jgi:hypothetical protein
MEYTSSESKKGLDLSPSSTRDLVYLLPVAVLVAFAFFLSTVTRNAAASIVGTVIFSLAFQGIAALPGLGAVKPYLLPEQFTAWQSLFGESGSIARAAVVCSLGAVALLLAGWAVFRRRDMPAPERRTRHATTARRARSSCRRP